ncbi:phosphoribosyl-ATP pyrophosphohydrolase family protein, partial [Vibrio parahaemolyticus V-223/04]
GTKFIQAT